ncbi:MAG: hypothetical protein N2111_00350 [Candidatus Sumerlaeaceae bacterium]|nr:hypothetical protein [Candidatus Sumerlaeaceae bacterium]
MNILPVGPIIKSDPEFVRYFRDLKRWNFDIAYNAFYAFRMRDVHERFGAQYRKFTRLARKENVPSCVQIQSTVAHVEDVPLSESQHYHDNSVFHYQHYADQGKVFHFASFGSRVWLDYLRRLTTLMRGYGFDWIVFEEPMLRTDIPGPDDPIRQIFAERHPELEYPTRQDESVAYVTLQKVKRDVLVEFYDALTRHARAEGFQRIGIMPWFFTPTFENTPAETWNSCCDTGRLTHLPNVDFIVVRMQPDNLWAQVVAPHDGECSPYQAYYECLAHHCGKPLIMVNNPTDEHTPEGHADDSLIPMPFFARYTLAATAAAPQGMSRHWYGWNYSRDRKHMALMTGVNALLRRLSPPVMRYAFVYSYAGLSHVYPRPCREVWRVYESFMRHGPAMHTFYAESLRACLDAHPQVDTLIFSEWFPIPPEEIRVVEKWVRAKASRRIIYVGGRNGYRWGCDAMFDSYRLLPPEMTVLWGVDATKPYCATVDYVTGTLGDRSAGGLSEDVPVAVPAFLPDAEVTQESPFCYVRRFRPKGGRAVLIPLSASDHRMDIIWKTIRDTEGDWYGFSPCFPLAEQESVGTTSCDLLPQTVTRNGYCVFLSRETGGSAANIRRPSTASSPSHPVLLWDVGRQRVVECHSLQEAWDCNGSAIRAGGVGLKVFRVIASDEPLLDVDGTILFWNIRYPTADSAVITGIFHQRLILTTLRPVETAHLDDNRPLRMRRLAPVEGKVFLHRVEVLLKTWHDGQLTIRFASREKTGRT